MASTLSLNWNDFCEGYSDMIYTDEYLFQSLHPVLAAEAMAYDDVVDFILSYVKKAVDEEGVDVNKIIRDYIRACLGSGRFNLDGKDVEVVVSYLLGRGASFPEDLLVGSNYGDGGEAYDDEFANYHIKGKLIDILVPLIPLPILHSIDWSKVKACYYEYLEGYTDNLRGKGSLPPLNEEIRYRALKASSTYLMEKYPNPEDKDISWCDEEEEDEEEEDELYSDFTARVNEFTAMLTPPREGRMIQMGKTQIFMPRFAEEGAANCPDPNCDICVILRAGKK